MKTLERPLVGPVLWSGLVVAVSLTPSLAEDVLVSPFNDASEFAQWRFDYGGVTSLIEFDATQDART